MQLSCIFKRKRKLKMTFFMAKETSVGASGNLKEKPYEYSHQLPHSGDKSHMLEMNEFASSMMATGFHHSTLV